jgi:sulfatase modifying factor 1
MIRKNKFILLILISVFLVCAKIQAQEKIKVLDAMPLNQVIQKTINNLVYVKGGCYMMGGGGTTTKHKVCLGNYYISKYDTTYDLYDSYTEITKQRPVQSYFLNSDIGPPPIWRTAKYPVSSASWQDSKNYCQWLSTVTGLPFDLPTEAQWEYAARSRGKNVFVATNNGKLEERVNYPYTAPDTDMEPFPVGTCPPNPLGLYDMGGDVNEWLNDWYDVDYFDHSPVNNPKGPKFGLCPLSVYTNESKPGPCKVLRGSSYSEDPLGGLYYRDYANINEKDHATQGFRWVLNTNKTIKEIKTIVQRNMAIYAKAH